MNTRSTFKRNAANCAKEFNVELDSPNTIESGKDPNVANDSCELCVVLGCIVSDSSQL